MPRASSQSSKALKSGFGLQEGIVKVTDACFRIHQFTDKEGNVKLSFIGAKFDYVKSDEQGNVEEPDNVMDQNFLIQIAGVDKDNPSLIHFDKLRFHPGKAAGPDDLDPEDLGTEVGTEGNSLWSDGASPFADSDWIEFTHSLEGKGFKPEVNDQSFAPNYIGMVFKFHTDNKPMRPGQAAPKAGAKAQTKWVVDQIYIRPYEGKGKKTSTKAAPAAKGAAAPPAANSNGSIDGSSPEVQAAFAETLKHLMETPSNNNKAASKKLKEEGLPIAEFNRAIANEQLFTKVNGKQINGALQKAVLAATRIGPTEDEPGWIEQVGAGVITVDRDAGTVSVSE